ncbi:hypothetical protein AAFF_G00009960 [Aldrovandia affinis]|uniref:Uncharacterized protein n=1 Tax=Aldrovandia affinis TaxID=143900 RepID=A0AAD7S700_9TELE|nr:hypothetical protein AAFF_G00009960 [Aldrovandia affinis]
MASIIGFMKERKNGSQLHISDQQKENAPLKRQLERKMSCKMASRQAIAPAQTRRPQPGGYKEAKRLLHKHYGDELRIASAYIDKALQWPQIKSEDGKALNAYAMFLVGCRNTMEDIESLEEMDNPTNLRTVVSSYPTK